MTDLEGNELEVGTIYVLPAGQADFLLGRFSHETASSYIFQPIRIENNVGVKFNIRSWKRQMQKHYGLNTIMAYKASEAIIKCYVKS